MKWLDFEVRSSKVKVMTIYGKKALMAARQVLSSFFFVLVCILLCIYITHKIKLYILIDIVSEGL